MISKCVVIMTLAIFGASARPNQNSNFQSSGCGNTQASSIPITQYRTSVIEAPTVEIPSFTFPTTTSESCQCMKTIVRPQLRKEVITVPSVDRFVQTVSTPIIEVVESNQNRQPQPKIADNAVEKALSNLLQELRGFSQVSAGGNKGCQAVQTSVPTRTNIGSTESLFGTTFGNSFGGISGNTRGSSTSLTSCNAGKTSELQFGSNSGSLFGGNLDLLFGGNSGSNSASGGDSTSFFGRQSTNAESSGFGANFPSSLFSNQQTCSQNGGF